MSKNDKHIEQEKNKVLDECRFYIPKNVPKNTTTEIVRYINNHINNPTNTKIVQLINRYFHSSYTYSKRTTWYNQEIRIQPGWRSKEVKSFFVYSDKSMAYNHKTQRMIVNFTDNTQTEISLYKFKRFCKRVMKRK